MIERQSPANLLTGRKRKLIARNIEADESDELFGCFHFGSPKSKPIPVNSSFDLRDHRFCLAMSSQRRKEFHHAWVCV